MLIWQNVYVGAEWVWVECNLLRRIPLAQYSRDQTESD